MKSDMAPRMAIDWADWRNNRRRYLLAWGLPTVLLLIGIFLPEPMRTIDWSGALIWGGVACLANAARCGRTHCHLTGPFFLAMAAITVAHGTGVVQLGDLGCVWIGLSVAGGTAGLWLASERLLGKYVGRSGSC